MAGLPLEADVFDAASRPDFGPMTAHIDIWLNGQSHSLPEHQTLQELVQQLGLTGKSLAISVDRRVIRRGKWAEHGLLPGARVEIVQAIGGG